MKHLFLPEDRPRSRVWASDKIVATETGLIAGGL
jgi:hypothetical protein